MCNSPLLMNNREITTVKFQQKEHLMDSQVKAISQSVLKQM